MRNLLCPMSTALLALALGWPLQAGAEDAGLADATPVATPAGDADAGVNDGGFDATVVEDGGSPPDAPVVTEPIAVTPDPLASPEVPAAEPQPAPVLETVIVGTAETRTSGAVYVLKSSVLERFERDDPHTILRTVPGVYAREEDGFGLRPNIGLRGANSDRSKKVTLLEDGVLFGPAPYSAPAAYFFPIMTRMQSVRVVKGPSAVVHGPQTVGGAIELITRDIPHGESFRLDVSGGQYLYRKAHARYGASNETSGFLIEGVHLGSAGFKQLDGGAETGFSRNEVMVKGRHRFANVALGKLEVKLGYSSEESDETYLGLTDEDFRATPLRRYGASALDHMSFDRTQAVLTHTTTLGPVNLTSTAYRQDFHRVWDKVSSFRARSLEAVLGDPTSVQNAPYYAVLTGAADSTSDADSLMIGPNDRTFVSQGVQTIARWSGATGPLAHDAEAGVRYHFDGVHRLHSRSPYAMVQGQPVIDPEERRVEVVADNTESAHAVALHALDAIGFDRFTVTPGLRVEVIRTEASAIVPKRARVQNSLVELLPGAGAHAQIIEPIGVFAGVYRGFSPSVPSQGASGESEYSVNYEAGARWTRRGERIELLGFFNDYSNLTSLCTESLGCDEQSSDTQTNVGRAQIRGIEALAEKTFRLEGGVSLPLSAAYTLTFTELLDAFRSGDPQFRKVRAGDELPYVPRHQLSASAGVELQRFGGHVSATYVSEMREEAGQGDDGSRLTDPLLTFDCTASWYPTEGWRVYLSVRNILDERAIASRRPFGARPNAPRLVQGGVTYEF